MFGFVWGLGGSFVPSVGFCAAMCVDAVLLHLRAIIWGKGISFFVFLSSCVRDSNQVVETIL